MTKRNENVNGGWRDEDEFTTTFGTLKQAMQESHELERALIVHELKKHLKLTRSSREIEGAKDAPEWDAGFLAALSLIEELNQ